MDEEIERLIGQIDYYYQKAGRVPPSVILGVVNASKVVLKENEDLKRHIATLKVWYGRDSDDLPDLSGMGVQIVKI
jgi:hypothetical protein